jgi:hypothetical protein
MPELLCTVVGSGVQLFGVFTVTLFFALLGMLSPASRGALMTVAIVVWLLMGLVGGYVHALFLRVAPSCRAGFSPFKHVVLRGMPPHASRQTGARRCPSDSSTDV